MLETNEKIGCLSKEIEDIKNPEKFCTLMCSNNNKNLKNWPKSRMERIGEESIKSVKLKIEWYSACFSNIYTKIGMIQGRLAQPLNKDDVQICKVFHILKKARMKYIIQLK